MKKAKFYVVWKGKCPGVYDTWAACEQQVKGVEGAQYKAFPTAQAAAEAFANKPENYLANSLRSFRALTKTTASAAAPLQHAIAVDAACSGNPGDMEYRGVYVKTGKLLFHSPVYKCGTNNIGEFLAIVHGLALVQKQGLEDIVIYSDSLTAQAWVKNKKCRTKLNESPNNQLVFERIAAAEHWLANNPYTTKVLKWDTDQWGEIPADFGRK